MVSYYKELGERMSEDDRIYLLIKALPPNYKMKLSNFLALTEPKSQNYEEIKASLNIFEREHAWNLISQNTPKKKNPPDTALYSDTRTRGERRTKKGKRKAPVDTRLAVSKYKDIECF